MKQTQPHHCQNRMQPKSFLPTLGKSVGILGLATSTTWAHQEIAAPQTLQPSQPARASENLESIESAGLTGSWGGARQALSDKGITPYVTYIGEIFSNESGGIREGSAWAGLLDFGLELDLGQLLGWEAATFFTNAFYFNGGDVSGDHVGDFNAVSNLYTDTRFNVYNIFLQQGFGAGDSFVKLGQIALDDDFMASESALLFLNASFGPLPIESGNTAAPIYSLAAPGIVVNYESGHQWFARAGIYNGDSGSAESSNQGFGWNTGSVYGMMVIAEGGYKYGENHGSVVKVGAYYHTGDYQKFSNGATERGLDGYYAIIDHQLTSADDGLGLNVFVRAGIAPQEEIAVVTAYAEAGIVAKNVFREDDALGLGASWTQFSDDVIAAVGGSSSETVIEVTYQIPVNDWFVLQPDLQYIINPQGSEEDAFVAGLRAEIAF
ncbi:carbohydrate porin [Coraliomargarita sp. W4R72]